MVTSKNLMNNLSDEYTFLFLGNTSFMGPPQREHAFAIGIAQRGFNVIFIEGMPSFGLKVKDALYSFIFNYSTENKNEILPSKVSIYTPPLVPTFFRSSYTPILDAKIFSRWFNKSFNNMEWDKTITIATFPYWWYGFFSRKKYPSRFLIYDKCDSLEVGSRNKKTLEKMQKAERILFSESDLITYSAYEMSGEFSSKGCFDSICIPNAVSTEFIKNSKKFLNSNRTKIGFVGAFDPRWIDLKLIQKCLEKFPMHKFSFIAPFRRKFNQSFSRYPNVELLGFKKQSDIPLLLSEFKVGLIPFLQNSITHIVNPLKLYEYSAAGIPVVAMRTRELEHYSDIIQLADSHDDFFNMLEKSLLENDNEKKIRRIKFAEENTWSSRIDLLLKTIDNKLSK